MPKFPNLPPVPSNAAPRPIGAVFVGVHRAILTLDPASRAARQVTVDVAGCDAAELAELVAHIGSQGYAAAVQGDTLRVRWGR